MSKFAVLRGSFIGGVIWCVVVLALVDIAVGLAWIACAGLVQVLKLFGL